MGTATIRRLTNSGDLDASVQRFVIQPQRRGVNLLLYFAPSSIPRKEKRTKYQRHQVAHASKEYQ